PIPWGDPSRRQGPRAIGARGRSRPTPAPLRIPRRDRPRGLRAGGPTPRLAPPQGRRPMNLDDLTRTSGEWLRGTGPESDIVMCSRIRLARNLNDFPFINRASRLERGEIESVVRGSLIRVTDADLSFLDVNNLSKLDRLFLVERQLISRE